MDELDFTKWVAIFDKALTSRDPAVKEQLSKLLMIAALATSDESAADAGPFSIMLDELDAMRRSVRSMQTQMDQLDSIVRGRSGRRDDAYDSYYKYQDIIKQDMMKKMPMPKMTALESWQDVIRSGGVSGIFPEDYK